MKRFELIIALILIPVDFIMLLLAASAAYSLRYSEIVTQFRPVLFDIPFGHFLYTSLPFIGLWVVIFALAGLYSISSPRKILTDIKKIFVGCSLGLAAITFLIFFSGDLFDSRFIVLASYVFAIVFVSLARFVVRFIRFGFYKKHIGARRVILVGNDKSAQAIDKYLRETTKEGR